MGPEGIPRRAGGSPAPGSPISGPRSIMKSSTRLLTSANSNTSPRPDQQQFQLAAELGVATHVDNQDREEKKWNSVHSLLHQRVPSHEPTASKWSSLGKSGNVGESNVSPMISSMQPPENSPGTKPSVRELASLRVKEEKQRHALGAGSPAITNPSTPRAKAQTHDSPKLTAQHSDRVVFQLPSQQVLRSAMIPEHTVHAEPTDESILSGTGNGGDKRQSETSADHRASSGSSASLLKGSNQEAETPQDSPRRGRQGRRGSKSPRKQTGEDMDNRSVSPARRNSKSRSMSPTRRNSQSRRQSLELEGSRPRRQSFNDSLGPEGRNSIDHGARRSSIMSQISSYSVGLQPSDIGNGDGISPSARRKSSQISVESVQEFKQKLQAPTNPPRKLKNDSGNSKKYRLVALVVFVLILVAALVLGLGFGLGWFSSGDTKEGAQVITNSTKEVTSLSVKFVVTADSRILTAEATLINEVAEALGVENSKVVVNSKAYSVDVIWYAPPHQETDLKTVVTNITGFSDFSVTEIQDFGEVYGVRSPRRLDGSSIPFSMGSRQMLQRRQGGHSACDNQHGFRQLISVEGNVTTMGCKRCDSLVPSQIDELVFCNYECAYYPTTKTCGDPCPTCTSELIRFLVESSDPSEQSASISQAMSNIFPSQIARVLTLSGINLFGASDPTQVVMIDATVDFTNAEILNTDRLKNAREELKFTAVEASLQRMADSLDGSLGPVKIVDKMSSLTVVETSK